MKHFTQRVCLLTAFSTGSTFCLADIIETTESDDLTTYCVPQTQVRGGYENLVIDHNMIIPPLDHSKNADIFIGARLKSRPEDFWLLQGAEWRKIDSTVDLRNSEYLNFRELPLVVPVSVFYYPTDVSGMVGDLEISVGYGFRSVTESAVDSFNEMTLNQRYELIWVSPPPSSPPVIGIIGSIARLCLETTTVNRVIQTVNVGGGNAKIE